MAAWEGVVPALVGVVVGTGLSFASNWLSDRSRWKRDHGTRWDERRLAAYSAYADAVKTQIRISRRLAAEMYPDVVTEPLEKGRAHDAFAAAEDRRVTLFEPVLLLGTSKTIMAAREWQKLAWDMFYHLLASGTTIEQFNRDFNLAGKARDAFLLAARADLSVGDSLDPSPPYSQAEDLRRRGP